MTGVGLVIHTIHKHGCIVLGGGGHDDLLGAGGDVFLARLFSEEESGGFNYDISTYFIPLQFGRIFNSGQTNPLTSDDQRIPLNDDAAMETSMHRIML